jgi:hypothetical protein
VMLVPYHRQIASAGCTAMRWNGYRACKGMNIAADVHEVAPVIAADV